MVSFMVSSFSNRFLILPTAVTLSLVLLACESNDKQPQWTKNVVRGIEAKQQSLKRSPKTQSSAPKAKQKNPPKPGPKTWYETVLPLPTRTVTLSKGQWTSAYDGGQGPLTALKRSNFWRYKSIEMLCPKGAFSKIEYFIDSDPKTKVESGVGLVAYSKTKQDFNKTLDENGLKVSKKAVYWQSSSGSALIPTGLTGEHISWLLVKDSQVEALILLKPKQIQKLSVSWHIPLETRAWREPYQVQIHSKFLEALPERARYVSLEEARQQKLKVMGPDVEPEPVFATERRCWRRLLKPTPDAQYVEYKIGDICDRFQKTVKAPEVDGSGRAIFKVSDLKEELKGPAHEALIAAKTLIHVRQDGANLGKGRVVYEELKERGQSLFQSSLTEGDLLMAASVIVWLQEKRVRLDPKMIQSMLQQLYEAGSLPSMAFYDSLAFRWRIIKPVQFEIPYVKEELETPYINYWFWKCYFHIILAKPSVRLENGTVYVGTKIGNHYLKPSELIDMVATEGAPYCRFEKYKKWIYHYGDYSLKHINKTWLKATKDEILANLPVALYTEFGLNAYAGLLPQLLGDTKLSKEQRLAAFVYSLKDINEQVYEGSSHPDAALLTHAIDLSMDKSEEKRRKARERVKALIERQWRIDNPQRARRKDLDLELAAAKKAFNEALAKRDEQAQLAAAVKAEAAAVSIERLRHPRGGYYSQAVAEWRVQRVLLEEKQKAKKPRKKQGYVSKEQHLANYRRCLTEYRKLHSYCLYDKGLQRQVAPLVDRYRKLVKLTHGAIQDARQQATRQRAIQAGYSGGSYRSNADRIISDMRAANKQMEYNNYRSQVRMNNWRFSFNQKYGR